MHAAATIFWHFLTLAGLIAASVFCVARAAEPNANATSYTSRNDPEVLVLDARQAGRGLMFSHMTIPVRPGNFTMVYPEWILGEHGPTGPLSDISQLRVSAGGRTLSWMRDQVDMYAFHVNVPPGVTHRRRFYGHSQRSGRRHVDQKHRHCQLESRSLLSERHELA
jgi:hypothetical protein